MTDDDLKDIEQRYLSLPHGPWKFCHGDEVSHWEIWSESEGVWLIQDDAGFEPDTEFLEFICHAIDDIPKLIREIRRLKISTK